jgi:hypothetical protein
MLLSLMSTIGDALAYVTVKTGSDQGKQLICLQMTREKSRIWPLEIAFSARK